MDSKPFNNSEIVDSIRNMAISRRGGVRTRGGRLPPINLREICQVTSTSKKIIAPNIPQRRRLIKQEPGTSFEKLIKTEPKDSFRDSTGRGRGRQPKVYLQTGGTFLAEGPALKTAKDPVTFESTYVPRASKADASVNCIATFDAEAIKELLDSCGEEDAFDDVSDDMRPYRLPPTSKLTPKIKVEPGEKAEKELNSEDSDEECFKIKIKTEPVEDCIKKEIKEEPNEDCFKKEIKRESGEDDIEIGKIKKEIKTEVEDDELFQKKKYSFKSENISKGGKFLEEFQNIKGKQKLVLLQIPRYTPLHEVENSTEANSKNGNKKAEHEEEQTTTFIDNLEEGFVGKLQIMKSGRMKVVMGSVEFEVFEGNPLESYWEAVSIQLRDDGGDLAVLGKLENKLIMSPVMNNLLKKDKDSE